MASPTRACDPVLMRPRGERGRFATVDAVDRFLAFVFIPVCPRACWFWTGYRMPKGYGQFTVNGRSEPAHRVSFEMFNGRGIEPNMQIDHRCEQPPCVNPEHLTEVTMQKNLYWQSHGRDLEEEDHYADEIGAYLLEKHREMLEA